jgi:hypothetical protein
MVERLEDEERYFKENFNVKYCMTCAGVFAYHLQQLSHVEFSRKTNEDEKN